MTATTASDPSGVEYYFECTAGGGNDSAWQDSTTYEDTGLSPSTQYTYWARARDKSTNQNATAWSTTESATTDSGIDPNLVAWWKFDETSGSSAADSSGNGNTGTLNGSPQWTTGHIDGAIALDGADDYVDGFSVNIGGVWSITAWAKPLASPEFQGLLGASGGGNYIQLQSYRIHYRGTYNNYTSFTQDLDWHHFALTRSASGDINVYIDGTAAGNYNDPDATFTVSEIGRFWGSSSYTYEGSVDDLRLYNRVLTSTEVQALAAQ